MTLPRLLTYAAGIVGMGIGIGAACSSGPDLDQNPDVLGRAACLGDPPPAAQPVESTAAIRGSVRIRNRRDRTLDAEGVATDLHSGLIQSDFADFTAVTSNPSAVMALSPSCVGVISRPTRSGRPVPLELGGLIVDGSPRGLLSATRTSTGVYVSSSEEFLMSGGENLRVVGSAALGGGGYPAFEERVTGVAQLELIQPASDGTGLIRADDLPVVWTEGDGDWVEIVIAPETREPLTPVAGAPSASGGQVVCVVPDDGCYVLPLAATRFLLASEADVYTLRVERRRTRSTTPLGDVFLEISASSEWKTSLDNVLK